MPPEQITHYRDASPAADQYSTAASLYRLLTSQHLFDFHKVPNHERIKNILFDEPVPILSRRADVPSGLAEAVHRALAKEPASRFADAAAFRHAVMPFVRDE
jgi:serine/threonine-protein kinase